MSPGTWCDSWGFLCSTGVALNLDESLPTQQIYVFISTKEFMQTFSFSFGELKVESSKRTGFRADVATRTRKEVQKG